MQNGTVDIKEEFQRPAGKRYIYFTIRSKLQLDPNNHLLHFEKGSGDMLSFLQQDGR